MTKKTPKETREKMLLAAMDLINTQGVAHLTLDAVAANSNVSKGGLLHHFPTKDALLRGLYEYGEEVWKERLAEELLQEPEGRPGRWSRAYIRLNFDHDLARHPLTEALVRAINAYPELFKDYNNFSWKIPHDDGLPPGRALVIQLACDGLWMAAVAGTTMLTEAETAAIKAELLSLSG